MDSYIPSLILRFVFLPLCFYIFLSRRIYIYLYIIYILYLSIYPLFHVYSTTLLSTGELSSSQGGQTASLGSATTTPVLSPHNHRHLLHHLHHHLHHPHSPHPYPSGSPSSSPSAIRASSTGSPSISSSTHHHSLSNSNGNNSNSNGQQMHYCSYLHQQLSLSQLRRQQQQDEGGDTIDDECLLLSLGSSPNGVFTIGEDSYYNNNNGNNGINSPLQWVCYGPCCIHLMVLPELPSEIWKLIFDYLPLDERCMASVVCK